MYQEANAAIDAALELDREYSGAVFLRAEVFRRTGAIAEADKWYRRFIDGTPRREPGQRMGARQFCGIPQ
jgi:Tfp pilus assembly protein PilF